MADIPTNKSAVELRLKVLTDKVVKNKKLHLLEALTSKLDSLGRTHEPSPAVVTPKN